MKRILVLAALAASALAMSTTPAHAILDGEPDAGAHPYVGAVLSPYGLCTGTKISPHRVLTAAHCMPAGTTATVVFDENARARTDVAVGQFTPHPGWCAGCGGGVPGLYANDVAVIVVAEPMSGPFASLPPLGFTDSLARERTVTSVGYGIRVRAKDVTSPAQFGFRYRVESNVIESSHRISAEFLRLSASDGGTCHGDSGGPSLVGDTIAGITAFAVNENCAGITYAQRVDTSAARRFVDGFAP